MDQAKIVKTTAFAATERVLLNYVTNLDDVDLGQAQVDSITYRVFAYEDECDAEDATGGVEVGDEGSLDVATTIYDDLQTDNGWPASQGDGWNAKFVIPAARLASAGWVRVVIT